MASALSRDNIVEVLRTVLLKIEFNAGPTRDETALAHLKCILLSRLADCEADLAIAESLMPGFVEIAQGSGRRLMPLLTRAEFEALEEATAQVPPQELD